MIRRLNYTIYKSEELYNKNKTSKTIYLLILRYIEASILLQDKNIFLQKAMNIVLENSSYNLADTMLKLFEIYLNIELEQYDTAEELLKNFKVFKSWYKNESTRNYAILQLLNCINEFKKNHITKAKKYYKAYTDEISYIRNNSIFKILQSLVIYRHMPRYNSLSDAIICDMCDIGSRSPLLYMKVYSMFLDEIEELDNIRAIANSIKWAVIHNLDTQASIYKIENFFKQNLEYINSYEDIIEQLYEKYSTDGILEILCRIYINKIRIDNKALKVYIEAKNKLNIYIENLDYIYLMAAYKNNYCDVDSKTVQKIISSVELEQNLQAFAYHLMLTKDSMKYMIPVNQYKILSFGENAFNKNLSGLYYNTIYAFMWSEDKSNDKLRNYILEQLFAYEIVVLNDDIKYIWIDEYEKQEIKSYTVKDKTVKINALNTNFNVYCLGIKQKSFYSPQNNIIIRKLLINSENLYSTFIQKGLLNLNLLIVLVKSYISQNNLTQDKIPVLKTALEYTELSNNFKFEISAALGSFFCDNAQYDIAVGYFSILEPDKLNEEQINKAILALAKTGNIEKGLLFYSIRQNVVFNKVKLILCLEAINKQIFEKEISRISFELLLNGRTEVEILENVLNYYDGTVNDLIEVKKILEVLNLNTFRIDKKILKKSLYTHNLNQNVQTILVDLYQKDYSDIVLKQFVEYIVYSILIEQVNITDNLLKCLEQEYEKTNDKYIQYAIASVYITKDMEINSYRYEMLKNSVKSMEQNQIMFYTFKQYKDKTNEFSYLEKNVPFYYSDKPNREIYLNYKLKDEFLWHKKKMRYQRFGIYISILTLFYNEVIEYYIEDLNVSSVNEKLEYTNKSNYHIVQSSNNEYYNINNAIIYSETLKYSEVENILVSHQSKVKYIKNFGYLI